MVKRFQDGFIHPGSKPDEIPLYVGTHKASVMNRSWQPEALFTENSSVDFAQGDRVGRAASKSHLPCTAGGKLPRGALFRVTSEAQDCSPTLNRRLAAIRLIHVDAKASTPHDALEVAEVMRGVRRAARWEAPCRPKGASARCGDQKNGWPTRSSRRFRKPTRTAHGPQTIGDHLDKAYPWG